MEKFLKYNILMNFHKDYLEKLYPCVEEGIFLHQLFRPVLNEKSHRINIFIRVMPLEQESMVVMSGG